MVLMKGALQDSLRVEESGQHAQYARACTKIDGNNQGAKTQITGG